MDNLPTPPNDFSDTCTTCMEPFTDVWFGRWIHRLKYGHTPYRLPTIKRMWYRVHVGYTRSGRDRWYYFETKAGAIDYCNREFAKTGIVLTMEEKQ